MRWPERGCCFSRSRLRPRCCHSSKWFLTVTLSQCIHPVTSQCWLLQKKEDWQTPGWGDSPRAQGVSCRCFGSQSLGLRAAVGGTSFGTWTINPLLMALPRRNASVS